MLLDFEDCLTNERMLTPAQYSNLADRFLNPHVNPSTTHRSFLFEL